MESIAEILKKARKAKGLSLEQVSKTTNIHKKYLKALEEGDYSLFPGETYAKGFLRNYSSFLDLNGEELVKRYSLQKSPPAPSPPAPKKKTKKKNLKLLYYVIFSLMVILLVFLIWRIIWPSYSQYLSLGLGKPEISEIPEIEVPPGLPLLLKEEETFPEPKVEKRALVEKEISLEPEAEKRELILRGVARDETWVEITVDGKKIEEGILEIGEEKIWKAKEKIKIKIGNAGGMELFLNERAIGVLGKEREVVTKVFALEDL
jgi:cytoskeletal protein RodZ